MTERPPYVTDDEYKEARRAKVGEREREPWSNGHDSPEFSEDSLALTFVARHAHELRYVAAWGKWFRWTGTHWEHENTLAVFDIACKICREAAAKCNKSSTSNAIAKAKTVAGVEMLSRSDRAVVATIEQWDFSKTLTNTAGGTTDLETGLLHPYRREDYCTKITSVAPGRECPMFLSFLNTIFAGDHELIGYLQKVFGYCLTGEIREHAMFFGYGTGANGKGVLLSTVAGIMGDYCKTAHVDTFTITGSNQHPTNIQPTSPGSWALAWSYARKWSKGAAGPKQKSKD